jgi:hypothetical protein
MQTLYQTSLYEMNIQYTHTQTIYRWHPQNLYFYNFPYHNYPCKIILNKILVIIL